MLGQKSTSLLEGKERKYPVEFDNASQDTDHFEITLPAGFKVEELPAPVEIDYGFAEYRSKTELKENVLTYSREFKVKEVMVGKDKLEALKKFYRQVAADERFNAVLQRAPQPLSIALFTLRASHPRAQEQQAFRLGQRGKGAVRRGGQ